MASAKVLILFQPKDSSSPILINFSESVVDLALGNTENYKHADQVQVCYKFDGTHFVIAASDNLLFQKTASSRIALLARSPFCPIKTLRGDVLPNLSPTTQNQGVNIGVSLLYESSDNNILLTQRTVKMRTFPNVWVPPGGHIDVDESLEKAVLREMEEETGIYIDATACPLPELSVLGLWESAYPPFISWGSPTRHHIVVYLHLKQNKMAYEVNSSIKLQATEVSCCSWICECVAKRIVESDPQFRVDQSIATCSSRSCYADSLSLPGAIVKNGATKVIAGMPLSPLLNQATESNAERVSTGTKFALKRWLENKTV